MSNETKPVASDRELLEAAAKAAGLSNDELQSAINAAWEMHNRTGRMSESFAAINEHLQALMKAQQKRAMSSAAALGGGDV